MQTVNFGGPTANPVTWALSGGDGIRTHGLYLANVPLGRGLLTRVFSRIFLVGGFRSPQVPS
jgi:hypothetical protein